MEDAARPRIVFVDDEVHVLDGLRRALRQHAGGWRMVFHVSAAEALAEQRRQPFAVAVVDMRMPEMTGIELIQAMNSGPSSPVAMVLTGAADLDTAITAINDANVFRFYTKPCAADTLAAGIADALARATPAAAAESTGDALGVAALNRLPVGVMVADRDGRVLFMNSRGAEQLAANDGLTVGPTGLCRAARPAQTAQLHRLIRAAASEGGAVRALSLSRDDGDRPLSVVVAPLAAGLPSEKGLAVMLISDPERQALPSAETVGRLFDLTEAEARLAVALSEGHRLEDAAVILGITVSSARTYLKRVFGKTDVTRQAELVRLVLATPTLADLDAARMVKSRS